jgi:hypothetical protein
MKHSGRELAQHVQGPGFNPHHQKKNQMEILKLKNKTGEQKIH